MMMTQNSEILCLISTRINSVLHNCYFINMLDSYIWWKHERKIGPIIFTIWLFISE
jgi:hypothetical protein